MTEPEQLEEGSLHPGMPIIAKAVCEFQKGNTRVLFATRYSLADVSVVAMRPPPIGTTFTLTLWPKGLPALPPLTARVIATRLDPNDAKKSSFEAVFTQLNREKREALMNSLSYLGLLYDAREKKEHAERRRNPRVWTDMDVSVNILDLTVEANLKNLGLSGALLVFKQTLPAEIKSGARMEIALTEDDSGDVLNMAAEIVHMHGEDLPRTGVKFVNLDENTADRIETIILRILGAIDGEFL